MPGDADEAMRTLEGIRIHVTAQVERLTTQADLRARLLQEEIDRRFADVANLMDERRDNHRAANALLQEEIDRRFAETRNLSNERRASLVTSNQLLQEEIDRRLRDLDKLNVQRFEDLKELMKTGQVAADKAVLAALASAEKAVTVAQEASEKRLDSVNEFRKTLSDQTGTFVPRPENDAKLKALEDRVSGNAERMTALELRLTRRLDLGQGEDAGERRQGTERRLDAGVIFQLLAVVISVAAIVTVIVLHG